jgi:hypothetical protein
MNIHRMPRLTPAGRALLARHVSQGWTAEATGDAAGVSLRTAQVDRAASSGRRAKASRPQLGAPTMPRRTPQPQVVQIKQLRRQRMTGPAIARTLDGPPNGRGDPAPPEPGQADGFGAQAQGDPLQAQPARRDDPPGHQEARQDQGDRPPLRPARAGDAWQQGHGWDFLHVCIDDASRLAYTEILAASTRKTPPPSWSAPSPGSAGMASASSG